MSRSTNEGKEMTDSNRDPAHPAVLLDLTVDKRRSDHVRAEISRWLAKPGVESLTVHVCAHSGIIPIACDLHEHLRDLRSSSRIPINGIASGLCGSAATLVLLALKERSCTDGAIFTMRKPFFERKDLYGIQSESEDAAISKLRGSADRFYQLFGAALGKNATDAMLLFTQDERSRGFTPQEAVDRGLVTEVIASRHLRAA